MQVCQEALATCGVVWRMPEVDAKRGIHVRLTAKHKEEDRRVAAACFAHVQVAR